MLTCRCANKIADAISVFVGRSSGSLQRLVELGICVDIREMKQNLSAEAKKSLGPEDWSAIRG